MANFQTHLAASTVLGIGYGGVAYGVYHLPGPTCVLAAGLCSVAGMLPDVDSGPGRPLREITTFLAAVVPAMLYARFQRLGVSAETIILIAAAIYAAIRFGLAEVLKRSTIHRGMFHSLPTAAICGLAGFLVFSSDETLLRWFIAGGVALGFLSHLLLDEIYSIQWDGSARLKKSFGTALKLFGHGWGANLLTYACLSVLAFVAIKEPALVAQLQAGKTRKVVRELKQDLHLAAPRVKQAQHGDRVPR
jgi:hypothetical protein